MRKTEKMKKSIRLVSATLATSGLLIVGAGANANASVNQNPFGMEKLSSGYMVAGSHKSAEDRPCKHMRKGKRSEGKSGEGKCGEGKCGGSKSKSSEGKCGEGKCG